MATPNHANSQQQDIAVILAHELAEQRAFMRDVMAQMTAVVTLAIGPVSGGEARAGDDRPMAAGAPLLEPATDDDTDPMEVFLGADFLRTDSALMDPNDPSPFGVPGLRAAV